MAPKNYDCPLYNAWGERIPGARVFLVSKSACTLLDALAAIDWNEYRQGSDQLCVAAKYADAIFTYRDWLQWKLKPQTFTMRVFYRDTGVHQISAVTRLRADDGRL